MKTPITYLAALVLLLTLAACGGDEHAEGAHDAAGSDAEMTTGQEEHQHMDGVALAENVAQPRMEGGLQVAEIEAGRMGYAPRAVHLEADIPARLVFTRTVDSECSSQIQIPAFDVPATDLPLGEPVAIEFTPDEAGDFTFVCGMDMQSGSIMIRS